LNLSRHVGRRWWWRVLITYNIVLFGQNIFRPIIANLVSNLLPSKYGMFLNLFVMDALQVACWFFTHIRFTSWVVSMLSMSMQNFGWLGFNKCCTPIKTHKLT
jgi:hypothetical protein